MKLVVISGGTATNALVSLFTSLSLDNLAFVLPISDNGGSTSELLRVIGGPAIGDIRSRITRLIESSSPASQQHLHKLFSYRLPDDDFTAKDEWARIVDGSHSVWMGMPSQTKQLIRPFFIEINSELLKRLRPGREFRFERANVGNLFLSGARIFCGSLDSSIELMLRLAMIPNSIEVLPVMNTNFTHHISALLKNGDVITGQSQISHPSVDAHVGTQDSCAPTPDESGRPSDSEDAQLPFTHPALMSSQIHFSKMDMSPMAAPIDRIFYINPYGHEIHPSASPRVIDSIGSASAVVFSIGSLYTSTIPVILLKGVAQALASDKIKKIFILNGNADRETEGMTARDYVDAIISACEYSRGYAPSAGSSPQYISHLIYLDPSPEPQLEPDLDEMARYGIECIGVSPQIDHLNRYDEQSLKNAIESILNSPSHTA
uniref:ARAD1D39490p n=1 Tax=Blastobotrys adeninivorans TaxID=409370 RepID=A0A060TCZ2_BLAAD